MRDGKTASWTLPERFRDGTGRRLLYPNSCLRNQGLAESQVVFQALHALSGLLQLLNSAIVAGSSHKQCANE